jgi:hypothetical protein
MNQSQDITISRIELTSWGAKITAHDNKIYNLSQKYKDGTTSDAWNQMSDMGLKIGSSVNIWYAEVPNKHGGTSRYIRSFRETNTPPQPTQAPKAPYKSNSGFSEGLKTADDRNAYERCCSIWAASAIQSGINPRAIIGELQATNTYYNLFQAIKASGAKHFEPYRNVRVNSEEVQAVFDNEVPPMMNGTPDMIDDGFDSLTEEVPF